MAVESFCKECRKPCDYDIESDSDSVAGIFHRSWTAALSTCCGAALVCGFEEVGDDGEPYWHVSDVPYEVDTDRYGDD